MIYYVHTQKNKNPLAVRNNQWANDKKRYPLMSRNIVTQKTSVVKVSGMKDTFRTTKGSLVTYSEILANHTAYDVDGLTAEQLAKRAKNAKVRKNSRKSSTSRTSPRNITDLSLNGESSHTSQANQRGKATAELVSRANEAEGVSPLSLTSTPAPITAKLAGDSVESAPDSIILNNIITSDEWPTVSISFDDDDFAPDALGDLITPQMQQQWQAQAVGATMESAIVESRQVAGDSEITVADSDLTTSDRNTAADYAEMYDKGLINEAELLRLCPLAMPMVAKRTAWMSLFSHDYSPCTATDQFGTIYNKSANGDLIRVTLADGREGGAYDEFDALTCALTHPFYSQAELAQFGEMAEANGVASSAPLAELQSLQNEISNNFFYARSGSLAEKFYKSSLEKIAALMDEYDGNPAPDSGLTLGDFVEADEPVASHPYPKRISPDSVVSSVEAGIYTLQCPADSHLAHTLESRRISHTAIPTLEAWGFVVAQDLKRDFGFFVTPKILRKKITQTIEKLNSAKLHNTSLELPDDAAFAADPALQVAYLERVISDLEGLL